MATWEDHSYLIDQLREASAGVTGRVYLFTDAEDKVLYVGQTSRALALRASQHYDKPELTFRSTRLKARRVLIADLDDTEAELIHEHHPEFNRHCPLCAHYNNPGKRQHRIVVRESAPVEVQQAVQACIDDCTLDYVSSRELLDHVQSVVPKSIWKTERTLSHMLGDLLGKSTSIRVADGVLRGWWLV